MLSYPRDICSVVKTDVNDQSPVTPGTPFLCISLSREDQRKLCSSGSGWRQCEGKGKFHPVPSTCPPTSFLFNTLGPIQTGKAGLASSAGPGLTAIPPSKGPEVTGPGLPWAPNCTCSPNCALTSARPQSYGASRFLDGTRASLCRTRPVPPCRVPRFYSQPPMSLSNRLSYKHNL